MSYIGFVNLNKRNYMYLLPQLIIKMSHPPQPQMKN